MRTEARVREIEAAPEPKLRPMKPYVIAAVSFLATWMVIALVLVALAAVEARSGWTHATAARSAGTDHLDVVERESALAQLSFDSSAAKSGSIVLAPIHVVPVFGKQLSSLNALARSAGSVMRAGRDALAAGRRALGRTHPSPRDRVAMLRDVAATAHTFNARLRTIDLGPQSGLLWPLSMEHAKAVREIDALRTSSASAAAGAGAMAKLLTGPSRYLLFEANNAEMRAGSGAFLRATTLDIRDGTIAIGDTLPTGEMNFPTDATSISPELQKVWGWLHPAREWRNLGVTPDFHTTADLAVRLWAAHTGRHVDGAIVVDAPALAALLNVTGPIHAAGRTISSKDAVEYLTHGQYVDGSDYGQRIERQGDVAKATLSALDQGGWKPQDLLAALGAAGRGRHLMVWSKDKNLESLWTQAHVDGTIGPNSILASVISRGGNKLDRFLSTSGTIATDHTGGNTHVTVSMTLHNGVGTHEPTYVAGPHPGSGVGEGVYLGVATLHLPSDALNVRTSSGPLAVYGRDGRTIVAGIVVRVPRGATQTITITFDLRGTGHSVRVEPSARVPGMRWTANGTKFSDDRTMSVKL